MSNDIKEEIDAISEDIRKKVFDYVVNKEISEDHEQN